MPPDRDLDRELRDLGPRIEYPPVPDLTRSVRGRLEGEGTGPSTRTGPQVWWIAAAALLLLVAVPIVSLAARGTGGGALSDAGGGAGEVVVESGGPEAGDDGPTRLVEEDESLAASAGGEASSSLEAEAGSPAASSDPAAACAYPMPLLEIRPDQGVPGARFGVRGRNFVGADAADIDSCNDTGASAGGGSRLRPSREARVDFHQGGRTWKLGVVKPGRGHGFSAVFRVPEDAQTGRATVTATGDDVLDGARKEFRVTADWP